MRKQFYVLLVGVMLIAAAIACENQMTAPAPATSSGEQPVESTTTQQEGELADVTRVIDGDTIDVLIDGQEYRIRYIGIDTPERDEVCYDDATAANAELVEGRTVRLVRDRENTDPYDRLLRYVYIDGIFVNELLVAEGWAETLFIPPNDTYENHFETLADQARAMGLGCYPTGVFDD